MTTKRPIPFAPDFSGSSRSPAGTSFIRAAAAELLRYQQRGVPLTTDEVLAKHFPSEQHKELQLLTRADTNPATTFTSGWASTLAQTAVADFLLNLGPHSAGSTLLRLGWNFSFDRAGAAVLVPATVADGAQAKFVKEGSSIPVVNFSFDSKTLKPLKLATIAPFTRETVAFTQNLEQHLRIVLTENIGHALDTKMFSADAEVAGVSPAGLLLGLSGETPSDNTTPREAFAEDVAALSAAVAPVAANSPKIFIASPAQFDRLYRALSEFPAYAVLQSSALAAGTVLCAAANAICSVIDGTLSFDVADQAVLVMTDAGSEMVAATGGTSVAADPMRSLYQSDVLALRVRLGVDFKLRHATGLAFMNSVLW